MLSKDGGQPLNIALQTGLCGRVVVIRKMKKILDTPAGNGLFTVDPVSDPQLRQCALDLRRQPASVGVSLVPIWVLFRKAGQFLDRLPLFKRDSVFAEHKEVRVMPDSAEVS